MSRAVRIAMLLCLLVGVVPLAGAATADPEQAALRAGYGQADSTWHVGSCAGQYCRTRNPLADPLTGDTDPHAHNRLKSASYGVQSRLTTRAIVVDGVDATGAPRRIALVKTDNYLAQDLLVRRVGQILRDAGSGITDDDILHAASHNHSSPYYTTPAVGVWVFEDAFDQRHLEFAARAMAAAILQAEEDLRPARMSATVATEDVFKANIAGHQRADDGSPAGYPRDFGDDGVTVMAFEATEDGAPIALWVNHGQHPEGLDGWDLVTADFLAPLERMVERDTGYPLVFSQGDVGSAEGPYTGWENARFLPSGEFRAWAHVGHAQLERGARHLADTVLEALADITAGDAIVPWSDDAVVDARSAWVPGPLSHPYPSVSNCRTDTTAQGRPGAPVVGLPDCGRSGGVPLPGQQVIDLAEAEGVPVPDHYDAPSFGAVEENARIRLQAFRVGEVLMASCACEAQVDLVLNLESRTDRVEGNIWHGYDWADPDTGFCVDEGDGTWTCDRRPIGSSVLTVSDDAIQRMRAQVHNDAAGWDAPENAVAATSENPDRDALWGNFTHTELSADDGYALPVGVGHAGDYNGYTVSYREYVAYDHYRKALTAYGPHTADYMVTRLLAMARAMNDPSYELPEELQAPAFAADEARQALLAEGIGRVSGPAYDLWMASLPDDVGPPQPLVQPRDITRFDATQFSWRGGSNAVDTPIAVVERLVAGTPQDGVWQVVADGSGEVPVRTDLPDGLQGVATTHAGAQEWRWTAHFEAFSAFPARLGQTAEGTYRFVARGHHRSGRQTLEYTQVSDPFTVSRYDGHVVPAPVAEGDDLVVDTSGLRYPRQAQGPTGFVHIDRAPDIKTRDVDGDGIAEELFCASCTFGPWARDVDVVEVTVTVERADGTVQHLPATPVAGRWVVPDVRLQPGDRALVAPGDLVDAFGEVNGDASAAYTA